MDFSTCSKMLVKEIINLSNWPFTRSDFYLTLTLIVDNINLQFRQSERASST